MHVYMYRVIIMSGYPPTYDDKAAYPPAQEYPPPPAYPPAQKYPPQQTTV